MHKALHGDVDEFKSQRMLMGDERFVQTKGKVLGVDGPWGIRD